MISAIITFGGISLLGIAFLLWMKTPKGKKWLESL